MKTYSINDISEILQCGMDVARSIAKRLPHCKVGMPGSKQPKIMVGENILNDYICGKIIIEEAEESRFYYEPRKAGRIKNPKIEYRK